jgi:hypothetical protein
MSPLDPRFSPENIKRLVDLHVKRFTNRIEVGKKDIEAKRVSAINVPECEVWLDLWKGIEAKGYEWTKMDVNEKNEVTDAVRDEEE